MAPTHQYVVPAGTPTGPYLIGGSVVFGGIGAAAAYNCRLIKNGVAVPGFGGQSWGAPGGGNGFSSALPTKLLELAAGDVVHIQGFCTLASWLTGVFSDAASHMTLHRIG